MTPTESTPWLKVFLLFLAGCSVSLNMGKVPPALPEIAESLNLNLIGVGWVVSIFSLLSATLGLLLGVVAARSGYRAAVIVGLSLPAIASLIGAFSGSLPVLLLSRALEGCGWTIVALSMPVVLTNIAKKADHSVVLGLWGAFVPTGMIVGMLYTPGLQALESWRLAWIVTACLAALAAFTAHRLSRNLDLPRPGKLRVSEIRQAVLQPAPLSMAGVFAAYSALYVIVTSFFPLLLIERHDMPISTAAGLGAFIIIGNIIGNVSSGLLLRVGVHRIHILIVAMLSMGLLALLIFLPGVPLALRTVAALLFASFGGLIPGTLFSTVSQIALNVVHIGLINGLILQAAAVGQFAGPIVQTFLVERANNWSYAVLAAMLFSSIGLLFIWWLQHQQLNEAQR